MTRRSWPRTVGSFALRIEGIVHRNLRIYRPTAHKQREGKVRMNVDSSNQVGRPECRGSSREPLAGCFVSPIERGITQFTVETGRLKTGSVNERNYIARGRALKILILAGLIIDRVSVQTAAQKSD